MSLAKLSVVTAIVCGFWLFSADAPVEAHGGAKGVVKQRMDGMAEMAKAMKTVGGMIRGKTPYDAAALARASRMLGGHGGSALTDLFPEGSVDAPSEAKPEIWQDWADFQALADQLEARAALLDEVSGNGLGPSAEAGVPSVRELFGMVGKTCSSCHEKYRLKKD
ncbi:c-type cytochrome [Roseibium polysiphoniae]|uniref:Cytochrome c n=1 Tax=Roseibium polysiphoniae TaxID=2571221 RepID=A0ABR9C8J8_9HYPH|nr:cytochrome c [Roseibium polysiphoniae]MBD8876224.1 cytochrome c [Roseibium polysiphoniae]